MPIPTLIVIGTSAGGVSALSTLIGALPNDLDAPVGIARHADPTRVSLLPQILSRGRTLTVAPCQSGDTSGVEWVVATLRVRHETGAREL